MGINGVQLGVTLTHKILNPAVPCFVSFIFRAKIQIHAEVQRDNLLFV